MADIIMDKKSANARLEGVIASLSAKEIVDTKLSTYKVVIFTKKGCPYCLGTKNMFRKHYKRELSDNEVDFMEVDKLIDTSIFNYLKLISGGSSMPMVFINGKYIGGIDEIRHFHDSGQLWRLFNMELDT